MLVVLGGVNLQTIVVVPCYNEANRLDIDAYLRFADQMADIGLLMVNDGSHDQTLELLHCLSDQRPNSFNVFHLPKNQGKAEAVRQGVLQASRLGARYLGYWDADLATPLEAICDLRDVLERRSDINVVLGSRLPLSGRDIQRRPLRRMLGRNFARVASRVIKLPLYDTQCGAKLFRTGKQTIAAFQEPFRAKWIFDVELLARLRSLSLHQQQFAESVYELPLERWHEIPGSKVRPRDFLVAIAELVRIAWKYGRVSKRTDNLAIPMPPIADHSTDESAKPRKAA
jgi:glycosyltransferase involved in cell wall biosynthesis